MPFELGLAVAWASHGNPDHRWYVFETRRFRTLKSLSDLGGTEVYIHNGTPTGVLREMANALARSHHRPTVRELLAIYRDLKKAAITIKRDFAASSLFDTRPFLELVVAASTSAKARIASLQPPADTPI